MFFGFQAVAVIELGNRSTRLCDLIEIAIAAAHDATGLEPRNAHRFVHLARLHLKANDIAGAETAQRQAEEQLRQSNDFRDALLGCTGSAVAMLDAEGNMAMVNGTLCELGGYAEADMLNQPWLAVIAAQDQPAAYEALTDVLPALGTHKAMTDAELSTMFGSTPAFFISW